jgi:hypothetical protein
MLFSAAREGTMAETRKIAALLAAVVVMLGSKLRTGRPDRRLASLKQFVLGQHDIAHPVGFRPVLGRQHLFLATPDKPRSFYLDKHTLACRQGDQKVRYGVLIPIF